MTVVATYQGDVLVQGRLVPKYLTMPADAISLDDQFESGKNFAADKFEQRFFPSWAQPNSASTTETRTLFVARRAGVINEVVAGSIAIAIGDSTVTVDVLLNGVSILSAAITLDNANVARTPESGVIPGSGVIAADDWVEVVIVATIGTGTLPTGVFVQLEVDQDGA